MIWHSNNANQENTMKRHITILVSPSGEEWFEAYGPMTKERDKATVFFTNERTTRPPSRLGRNGDAFWECEKRAETAALKEYKDWTYRFEEVTA
jgi:hypothetical protein